MPDFAVRFNDYKGGDWGSRDPSRADKDQWHGENLVPYRSGLLGPRAGVKPLAVTGLPTHPVVPGPVGFAVWGTRLLVVLNRVYEVPQAGGAASAWAVYPASAATPVRFAFANGKAYSLLNGVLYRHDFMSATTAITTPAPLSNVVRWGYYLVGTDLNRPWRIWFSQVDAAGAAFDTWPANNFLDIATSDPITALVPLYNTLYCGKREGWWSVSGVLGVQASVRDIAVGNGPTDPRLVASTTDNRVIYWPVESVPAWFNGERVYLEGDQEMVPRALPFIGAGVIVAPTSRRLFLAGDDPTGNTTLIWTHAASAWTHHRTVVRFGAMAPGEARSGSQMPEGVIYLVVRPTTIGDPCQIASYHHDLDRPGHTSDQYASPWPIGSTELVTGHAELPSWYDGQGRQVQVRTVIVQFRKWASGDANTVNRLQCKVNALGRYAGGLTDGEIHEWVEPSSRGSSDGLDDSWRINLGEQGFGNGFQITFPAVAGVAIRDVIALVNVRTERN